MSGLGSRTVPNRERDVPEHEKGRRSFDRRPQPHHPMVQSHESSNPVNPVIHLPDYQITQSPDSDHSRSPVLGTIASSGSTKYSRSRSRSSSSSVGCGGAGGGGGSSAGIRTLR